MRSISGKSDGLHRMCEHWSDFIYNHVINPSNNLSPYGVKFSPGRKCFRLGGNVKCFRHGEKFSPYGENFSPRQKCFLLGKMLLPYGVKFSPGRKCFRLGGNVFAMAKSSRHMVRTFRPGRNVFSWVKCYCHMA